MEIANVLDMPNGVEKATELAIRGFIHSEYHHKQWYLEQVLLALGVNLDDLRQELMDDGECDDNGDYWPESIAP